MKDIVEVRWKDITTHDEIPATFEDYEKLLAECVDYGVLLYKDEKIVVISNHTTKVTHDNGQGEDTNDITIIPMSVVTKIRKLK